MGKWKCGICNSEFDNYQAQGFNGIIYCPLCYFKELYKREKQEKEDYKSRCEKAIELINKRKNEVDELLWVEMRAKDYFEECDEFINILQNGSDN